MNAFNRLTPIIALLGFLACSSNTAEPSPPQQPAALDNRATATAEGRCTAALDRTKKMALDAARQMAVATGDAGDAQLEAMRRDIARSAERATEECRAVLNRAARLEKAIDCVLAAEDMDAVSRCEGADELMITSEGDKCSRAADKMMAYMKSPEMEAEMQKMLDQLPEDMRREAESEMRKEMAKADERKDEMIAQCQSDLRDPDKSAKTEMELDCILASKTMEDASNCMGLASDD